MFHILAENAANLYIRVPQFRGKYCKCIYNTFEEIVKDLGKSVADDNCFVKKVKSQLTSVKNLMSDQCATQKKFIKIFTEFQCLVLPDIASKWEPLLSEHQEKMKIVNDFYCWFRNLGKFVI